MTVHILPMLQFGIPAEKHDGDLYRKGVHQATFFHAVTIMLIFCYVKSILQHPGGIPDDDPLWAYTGDGRTDAQLVASINLQEMKKSGDRRHCKWCGKYKPDRCHHCRVCRTCILKMDHHCPWIYNCVGFYNYKFFFLLLFYSVIDLNFMAMTMYDAVLAAWDINTPFLKMFLVFFAEALCIFLSTLVTAFFIFHSWLMMKAMTTIEFCEKKMPKGERKAKDSAIDAISVYDQGCYENVKSVLGPDPFTWLLPIAPGVGNGLNYVTETTRLTKDMEAGKGVRRKTHQRTQRVPPRAAAEFDIYINKTDDTNLGIDLSDDCLITGISKGLVKSWNKEHSEQLVELGDRIVEVNGIRGDISRMMTECRKSKILRITLQQHRT